MSGHHRTILVSNRLPVTASVVDGELELARSVGGLAAALAGAKDSARSIWIGWPGASDELAGEQSAELERHLQALDCVSVLLSRQEVEEYYEGISNDFLWPLFHYQTERLPLATRHWDTYEAVNARFAMRAAEVWRPGDDIWVHDYQLLLVPSMLRQRLPEARIGFFLHVPFPAPDVYRILPWRREVLHGMLGADLVGFHTSSYASHFIAAAHQLLGAGTEKPGCVRHEGRETRVGAYPIGVDAGRFESLAARPEVHSAARILAGPGSHRLIAGVDRLDYTKGIPRRLLAFEELLRRRPAMHRKVRLVQVVVPSREGVRTYREFRTQVEAAIGRINGAFGTAEWTPVSYVYRSLDENDLAALYLAADVMFVTPLRDGMNLVAKEFVATRADLGGVLVLSEFTGAAEELHEALLVNPYDVDRTADALHDALTMPEPERRRRMAALRERVFGNTAAAWATAFLADLRGGAAPHADQALAPDSASEDVAAAVAAARAAPARRLLLDYDGTLTPLTPDPSAAAPDDGLLELLANLAAMPATVVHIVSGRTRAHLDAWLGHLHVFLHAEHGLWSRRAGERDWVRADVADIAPYDELVALMHAYAEATPGALVERKSAGLAWHYRMADESLGEEKARDLAAKLDAITSGSPLEVLRGSKVLEVRPRGIHKGLALAAAAAPDAEGLFVLAMGDDRTDEDLFAALPAGAVAVHVGPSASRAGVRLADVHAARAFLGALVDGPPPAAR